MEKIFKKKEIARYLISGICVGVTDFVIYYTLFNFLPYSVSKAISYICSRIVGYVFSKHWTFEQHKPSKSEIVRFVAMNILTLGINVFANQISLSLLRGRVFLAWVIAITATNIVTFGLLKCWVFKTCK